MHRIFFLISFYVIGFAQESLLEKDASEPLYLLFYEAAVIAYILKREVGLLASTLGQ